LLPAVPVIAVPVLGRGNMLFFTREVADHCKFRCQDLSRITPLVNPNNPVARAVLTLMVETGDYFFLALDSNSSLTAFRSVRAI
jgi:hypothetical protein